VDFPDKAEDCAGILAEDACLVELSKMPKEKREDYCARIKTKRLFTSFKESCPEYAAVCEPEEKKPKCGEQKTPPWFDTAAKCDPLMWGPAPHARAEPHSYGVECRISYTVCGSLLSEPRYEFFRNSIVDFRTMSDKEAEAFCESKGFGKNSVPFRMVCCQKWNQAFTDWIAFRRKNGPDAPGHPCNPAIDADCDGTSNFQDPTPLGDCAEYPGRPSPSP
jgi:hypothetical protein